MNDCKIPYAVAGAFALQEHTGIWRDAKDLDLFIPPEYVSCVLQFLQENGFETEVLDPVWLAKAHRGEFFVDLITGMSNGVITVDVSWIERSRPAEIVGIPSRVLAPEELLVSKLFVIRRERFDGADICHIIYRTHGLIDWDRVLYLVGSHWELLLWMLILYHYVYPFDSNYVPRGVWDELLRRFRQEIANPSPDAKFRGSLIDDKMFAVDVSDWGLSDLLTLYRERRQHKFPTTEIVP